VQVGKENFVCRLGLRHQAAVLAANARHQMQARRMTPCCGNGIFVGCWMPAILRGIISSEAAAFWMCVA
jgi:hypothetical protein